KLDGSIVIIPIIRDIVILEETYAKSTIIKDKENNTNIGYLKLPSFYVDFNKKEGRNCTEDVEKEIEKLKQENVSGIIFDLRNNGGGSLEDVVKIAGLFIEEGPVVQAKSKHGFTKIRNDKDTSIQFDGTLVVMVNSISASASEIFAAAMQDYERAIIIGSSSTFGKGTVQNFSDLDRFLNQKPDNMKPLGSLKLTVQKFYRINGGATQLKGITPDIVLPDYYNYIDYGEKDLEYTMPWDEISAAEYKKWNLTYDFDFIKEVSSKRVQNDIIFNLIDENGKRLKKVREETSYTLNFKNYNSEKKQKKEIVKKYERIGKDTLGLNIYSLNCDLPEIEADTAKKARIDAWILNLKKDIYLSETVNVINDIENSKNKNAIKEN
ncbi:MAG: carboxy terminal-processing peptidase, partial [Bacteroidales bacterium]|nr:carboxy terminal-processing peptidase [Bacteroidales bacterium]